MIYRVLITKNWYNYSYYRNSIQYEAD